MNPIRARCGVACLCVLLATSWSLLPRVGWSGDGSISTTTEVDDLVSQVRSGDDVVHLRAILKLGKHLRPGMTKRQVEALLGPPDQDIKEDTTSGGLGEAIYFCLSPGAHRVELMSVCYKLGGKTPLLVEVSEPYPHFD